MGSSRRRGRWSCGSMHALRNNVDGDEGEHTGVVFRLVAEVGVAMVGAVGWCSSVGLVMTKKKLSAP